MGEDIRAAWTIEVWANGEPSLRWSFFRGARDRGLPAGIAAVVTAVMSLREVTGLAPFLSVVLAELVFMTGAYRVPGPRGRERDNARERIEAASVAARSAWSASLRGTAWRRCALACS